jgi:hypothetical protein
VLVADAYPNFSICGLPDDLSGDVTDWRDLAHRTTTHLEQAPTTRSRLGGPDWGGTVARLARALPPTITDARCHRTGHRLPAEQATLPPPAAAVHG